MSCASRPEAWGIVVALAAVVCPPQAARAQGWTETQAWAVGTASRPAAVLAGVGVGWRDRGRTRLGGVFAAGVLETGDPAGRLEFTYHFLLDPGRTRGAAVYGGGGLALASGERADLAARVLITVGADVAPAAPRGWFVELGLGGGARLAAGFRWRTRSAPGR